MTTARPDVATLLQHQEWVRALARSLVRDATAADDVAQAAMLEAVTRAPADLREPKGWLARVTRNAARAFTRQQQRRTRREQVVARAAAAETAPDPAETVQRAAAHKRVVDTLFALPEPYHTVVVLRYFEDIDAHEIARRLDRPLATVRTQLQRGLTRMRERLDAEFGGDRGAWCAMLAPLLPAKAMGGVPLVVTLGAFLTTHWMLSAAAALLVLACFLWQVDARRDAVPLAQAPTPGADAVVATDPDAELAPGRTAAAASPRADAPDPALAAPAVRRGRLVTIDGQSLAGVVVASRDPRAPRRVGDRLVVGSTSMDLAAPGNRESIATPQGRQAIAFGFGAQGEAVLALLEGRPLPRPRATTDGFGRFTVERASERDELELEDEGLMLYGEGRLPEDEEMLFVAGPAVTIAGIVRDERGAPLPGAFVSVGYSLDSLPGICTRLRNAAAYRGWSETTERDGTFVLGRVPALDVLWVHAQKRGHLTFSVATSDASLRRPVDWTLREDARKPTMLTGLVLHADGRPAAGASVFFGQDSGLAGDDGRFALALTSWSSHTMLAALVRGHEPCIVDGLGARLRDDATAGQGLELRLGGPARTLAGRVLGADGEPLPGMRVVLVDARQLGSTDLTLEGWISDQRDVGSDAQGRFELRGLSTRQYTVRAVDPQSLLVVSSSSVAAGTTDLELRAAGDAFLPHLDGVLVDRHGAPVAGATIDLRVQLHAGGTLTKTLRRRDGVVSDANGRFRIVRCPREHVQVVVHGDGLAFRAVDVPADGAPLRVEVVRRLRFRLTALGASPATAFEVHDAGGAVLFTTASRPGVQATDARVSLRHPASAYEVDDRAATLVLFAGKQELRREALTLRIGDVTEISY